MNDRLQARVAAFDARIAKRRFQQRQRHLAGGVWMRLAEHAALTEFAYRIDAASVDALLAQGAQAVIEGSQLQPRKVILVAPAGFLVPASAAPIPVRIGPEFLAAEAVLLVAFPRAAR